MLGLGSEPTGERRIQKVRHVEENDVRPPHVFARIGVLTHGQDVVAVSIVGVEVAGETFDLEFADCLRNRVVRQVGRVEGILLAERDEKILRFMKRADVILSIGFPRMSTYPRRCMNGRITFPVPTS